MARGNAKNYAYWGAAVYEIRPSKDGQRIISACVRGASSDQRSIHLAIRDADELASRIGAVRLETIGTLDAQALKSVLSQIL